MLFVLDTAFYVLLILLLSAGGLLAWDTFATRREEGSLKSVMNNVFTTMRRRLPRGDWPARP